MRIPIRLTAFALLAACSSFASAAIVASTGFETTDTPAYPAAGGLLPSTNTLPLFSLTATGTPGIRNILPSSSNPFGTGQYLELGSDATITGLRAGSLLSPVTSIVFDLYEPTGFSGAVRFGFGAGTSQDINSANSDASWVLNNGVVSVNQTTTVLVNGVLPTLTQNTHYKAHAYLNTSSNSETLNFGTGSITLALDKQVCCSMTSQPTLLLVPLSSTAILPTLRHVSFSALTPATQMHASTLIISNDMTRWLLYLNRRQSQRFVLRWLVERIGFADVAQK